VSEHAPWATMSVTPARFSASTILEPMNPAAPVTT
jgi:hypothetical protein